MKNTAQNQLFSRVSFLDRLLFTKHLAVMIKAGIPVAEALAVLTDQTRSRVFKKVLSATLSDLENGQSLAKSLAKYPKVFDHFYISLIEVSEESGTLEENLDFLAKQLAKNYNLRKKIQSAMLYPGLVLGAATIMGGFIALFILPKLVDFFSVFEIELPLTTRILLFVASTMKNYSFFIVGGLVLLTAVAFALVSLPKVKPKWHAFVLKLPLIGALTASGQLAHFARNLGGLLRSGVPVTRALEVTANTLSNLKFRIDTQEIGLALSKGQTIGTVLGKKKYSEFPPITAKMILVGEKTGKLDETLLYLGDFYEDEIDNLAKNLSTILEPVLLITIGLLVGLVALAIISPIYELTGSIRR